MEARYNREYEIQLVGDEFKSWKKEAYSKYDLVITPVLECPSLTCQWLPVKDTPPDSDYNIHKLLLGTKTPGSGPNYLMVAKVRIPTEDVLIDIADYDMALKDKVGAGTNSLKSGIEIETKILHKGPVNRARYMPQKYNIIATKTNFGEVHIYDYSQHPPVPENTEHIQPELILTGHTANGLGLMWNEKKPGYILSSGEDAKICLWNIDESNQTMRSLKPIREFTDHKGSVEDVCWHPFLQDLFGSVGVDRHILIHDLRQKNLKPTHDISAHFGAIRSIDFNKNNEYIFITGSADSTICLWDIRNTSKSVNIFEDHKKEVVRVEWSPNNSNLFASCSKDRRINIWDLSKIDKDDSSSEPLFDHNGHQSAVPDFSWNINDPWLMASVEEGNNIMHIWQISSSFYSSA